MKEGKALAAVARRRDAAEYFMLTTVLCSGDEFVPLMIGG
jgi:hypothetical protein